MATLTVTVPGLLADAAGGRQVFSVEGDTLGACLEALFDRYPLLRHHLYEPDGVQRPHTLIRYNDDSLRSLPSLDIPVQRGDRLDIIQLVSGG